MDFLLNLIEFLTVTGVFYKAAALGDKYLQAIDKNTAMIERLLKENPDVKKS